MGNLFVKRLAVYLILLCLFLSFVYLLMQYSIYFVVLTIFALLSFPIIKKKYFSCPLCHWPSTWDRQRKLSWIGNQCALCGLNFDQPWDDDALNNEFLKRDEERKDKIEREKQNYPKLSQKLRTELSHIRPIKDEGMVYYPCDVKLDNGEVKRNVILVDAGRFLNLWGGAPNDEWEVMIKDVVSILEASNRLPELVEDKLTQIHETRMGGVDFRLILKDGSEVSACTGNYKYFLDLKNKLSIDDIVDVRSVAREEIEMNPQVTIAKYYWCLFS